MEYFKSESRWCQTLAAIRYHTITLWLFTANDLKTMVLPSTAFAIFYCLGRDRDQVSTSVLFSRLPCILLWAWVNLLAFTINNQHHPAAVIEDRLNKPWRPIPAGRISPKQARTLGLLAYPLSLAISYMVGGGLSQSSLLVMLGWIYNNPRGYNSGFIVRNALNAAGFTSFASGAVEVALRPAGIGQSTLMDGDLLVWLGMVAAIVLTSVHSQDMYDQVGDAAAGRRTLPLVIGDGSARWSISVSVAFWSVACPWYWHSGVAGYTLTGCLGTWVIWRTLRMRSVREDKATFVIYNAWLVGNYSLPLVAHCRSSLVG